MKRIFRLMTVFLSLIIIGIKGVSADTVNVTRDYIDDVWSFHYRNGDMWTFGNLPFNYANGELIYCIQPDARINTSEYYEYYDFNESGYSEYEKNQMELISYYGYGYPGHESVRYYMATQELLWLFSPDEWITWNTSKNEDGENIDISYEKYEIMKHVNNHNVKPSFYQDEIVVDGTSIALYDSNLALDNYDIIVPEGINYYLDGNNLTIDSNKIGTYDVRFVKRRSINRSTLLYNNESLYTQKLAIFGEPYTEEFSIRFIFNKARVEIIKKDSETNELIMDEGIKVKIKNTETDDYLEEEFVNGKITVLLPVGKYSIEEISASYGYSINEEEISLLIENGGENKKYLEIINEKVKGIINIYKMNEEGEYLTGVTFDVYDSNNEIVDTIKTEDGIASTKELPLGEYIIKEKENIYGYEKNDTEYKVSVEYEGDSKSIVYENIDIINKKIKCEITLITTSDEEVLNTEFNIYDTNFNLIYSGMTIDGEARVSLPYGDYILKEISVPDGYKLSDEEIRFSVNDEVCASKFSINNEKVFMPNTYTQGFSFYYIVLFINMVGYVFYKKSN